MHRIAKLLIVTMPLLLGQGSLVPAQNEGVADLYSVWVQLSLRGHPQEAIESLLRNMDPEAVQEVKARLRRTVLSNLELKNLRKLYLQSSDSDDLNLVRSTIETELRFTGLQNDEEIKTLIKERFGVSMDQLF